VPCPASLAAAAPLNRTWLSHTHLTRRRTGLDEHGCSFISAPAAAGAQALMAPDPQCHQNHPGEVTSAR
jgi:hypothetical protein